MTDWQSKVHARLAELAAAGLTRTLTAQEAHGAGQRFSRAAGGVRRSIVDFCSNDYLGFAASGRWNAALAEGATHSGASSGSSRLISGERAVHGVCEAAAAAWLEREAALLFASGFQANTGAVAALAEVFRPIISDELNHASIIDGCRLAHVPRAIVPHLDVVAIAKALEAVAPGEIPLVVIEGLYSMDGDAYDFAALAALKRQRPFVLFVDEAHALGVYGPEGRGVAARQGMADVVDVYLGTMGKALGLFGAFVASTRPVIELLLQRARPFVFSTGAPPALAYAAAQAITGARAAERERIGIEQRAQRFRAALRERRIACGGAPWSAIVPIVVGESTAAVTASRALLDAGYFVQAIRPPTVPDGTARLRVSLSAGHDDADVDGLVEALARVLK